MSKRKSHWNYIISILFICIIWKVVVFKIKYFPYWIFCTIHSFPRWTYSLSLKLKKRSSRNRFLIYYPQRKIPMVTPQKKKQYQANHNSFWSWWVFIWEQVAETYFKWVFHCCTFILFLEFWTSQHHATEKFSVIFYFHCNNPKGKCSKWID